MSSPTVSSVPKLDPALYGWTSHPTILGLYQRRAFGPETKWAHKAPHERQLYLTGHIKIQDAPCSTSAFSKAAKKAWLRLRFDCPEIVQLHSGEFNSDGSAVMQCEIPQDHSSVEKWSERTFSIGDEFTQRGEMAPVEVAMRQKQITSDPVSVLWHAECFESGDPESTKGEAMPPLTDARFCLRVDHGLADGMGAYILAGKYLKLIAEFLGGLEQERVDWPKAVENMPKPWVKMMNEKQKTGGNDFEEGVKTNTDLVMESLKSKWGLKIQPVDGYQPASIHRAFSPKQSTAILRSIKEKLGPSYSITCLGHAATVMTMLKFKSPKERPVDQPHIVSPLFANGRRYLDTRQFKSVDHIPMCRAIGAVEFRDVERYILSEKPGKEEIQQKLRIACEEARRSYQRIREQESLLTESFSVAEVMATAKNEVKDKGMADPFFLSDGIVEQYTPRSYTNSTGSTEVLTLDDIRFTAVPDGPPLIIRMSSFRDTLHLSAEWNAVCYAEALVKSFLGTVMKLMLSFTDEVALNDTGV